MFEPHSTEVVSGASEEPGVRRTCAPTWPGVRPGTWTCSARPARTWRSTPAGSKDRHLARATVARRLSTVIGLPGSWSSTVGWTSPRPSTCAGPGSRPSPRPSGWTGCRWGRVSEACSVDLEDFGAERGHRTLHIIGKGGKPALIPIPPPGRPDPGPGRRRTGHRPAAADPHRAPHGPLRRLPDRAPPGQEGRDGPPGGLPVPARCPDRCPPRRPPHHRALRPGPLDRHANYVVAAFIAGAA